MVNGLRKFLPETWVYRITRTRNIAFASMMYNFCQIFPDASRRLIQRLVKKEVGDERLCAVPDGDMFQVLHEEKASIVTDLVDHFTENSIKLKSGENLDADIIITATGLDVQLFGKMKLIVDGKILMHMKKWYIVEYY